MESNLISIKKNIMLRVRFIHLIKRVAQPLAVKTVLFAAALYFVGRLVFVAKVFENAPAALDLQAFTAFFARAFLNTEFMVQAMLLAAVVFAIWAIRDVAKTFAVFGGLRMKRI